METMSKKEISLSQLVERLDSTFGLYKDPAMQKFFPSVYEAAGIDCRAFFEKDFLEVFNGLMLKGSSRVQEVFCIVFPTPDVIREILSLATHDTLIFTHHPIDMMTGGVGFLPIAIDLLRELHERQVSVYSMHAPMDTHTGIGTNAAIAKALKVVGVESFAPYGEGFAGRIGTIKRVTFSTFIERLERTFGVEPKVGGGRINNVNKIAIVAGGGDEVKLMREAEQKGCDVYLTGEWFTRTRPIDEEARKWAIDNDIACREFAEKTRMGLVAVSHAASEFLVMKLQMVQWFEKLGLESIAVPQRDWWR